MPSLTSAQKSAAYRQRKIASIGYDKEGRSVFLMNETKKRKERRAKAKEAKEAKMKAAEAKIVPAGVPSKPNTQELKQVVKRLNEYLNKDSKVDVPTVVRIVKQNISPSVLKITNEKNCNRLKQSVFTAKFKFLEGGFQEISNDQQFDDLERVYTAMTNKKFKCKPKEFELFHDTKRVIHTIENNDKWPAINTKKKYYSSLSGILNYLDGYEEAYKVYSSKSTKKFLKAKKIGGDNKLKPKEKANWVDQKTVSNAYKSKGITTHYDRALLGLFTLIPPRRRLLAVRLTLTTTPEFKKMKKEEKEKNNWLFASNTGIPNRIMMYRYKTDWAYGPYRIPLTGQANKTLRDLLKTHIRKNEIKQGEPVFYTTDGGYMDGENMSNYIQKVFKKAIGKEISFNLLRHIKITYYLQTQKSENQKEELAEQMGHDVKTQATYVRILK
jgi:hypothetical protein